MQLLRYKVENFRSVEDSGWIECDNVTTLVGINEAGKSNLLLALWKLNPAREGKIDILHDMPVSSLSTLRGRANEIKFISAEFSIDANSAEEISSIANVKIGTNPTVIVSRYYDGHYDIEFSDEMLEPLTQNVEELTSETTEKMAVDKTKLQDAIISKLPKFVYYSNYGNLSTKIYLPNVVKWLKGQTIQGVDTNEDQVRTLRVLFDFVNLKPEEILELGKDPKIIASERCGRITTPTKSEIKQAEDDKEKRSILLQSASKDLTIKFRDWWKQGEYRFRFEADGDYFRIWVADSIRPDEVGLELRSTGLQWFISFYLIFLVESQENHKNAILLLDEAGLTLHPLAQKDLARFFDNLAENNQIINTTHSPFIVDPTNIDRCRVVYIDKSGHTAVSSNLRQGSDSLNEKSIYAVHAALGLSVSDILLQGCQNVVVEGPTDQFYLNAIKSFLIREKLFTPKQEIVFIPSGGVKGVPGVVSILCGKNEQLPYVIIDSDKSGKDAIQKLKAGLYREQSERIIEVDNFADMSNSEIEDIIPFSLISRGINRMFLDVEDVSFEDEYDLTKPIIPQIENFAAKYNKPLTSRWKVDLAKSFKQVLKNKKAIDVEDATKTKWTKLFEAINQ